MGKDLDPASGHVQPRALFSKFFTQRSTQLSSSAAPRLFTSLPHLILPHVCIAQYSSLVSSWPERFPLRPNLDSSPSVRIISFAVVHCTWNPAPSFISYAQQPIFRRILLFAGASSCVGEGPFLGVFSVIGRILVPAIIDNSAPRGINSAVVRKRNNVVTVPCTLDANYKSPSFSTSLLGMWLCRRILKLEIDLRRVVLLLPFRPLSALVPHQSFCAR